MNQRTTKTKNVLLLSYYYPPVSASGTHRTRAVARHLPSFGWRPIVTTALNENLPVDPLLLEGLREDLVVYRTAASDPLSWGSGLRACLKKVGSRLGRSRSVESGSESSPATDATASGGFVDRVSWWLHVPDLMVGWLPWGLAAGLRAARRHGCEAIYSSAPPWTTHLIAMSIKRLTGLPWVADFRDPWRTNPFHQIPYATVDRFDAWLEERVVRHADRIICNNEHVRQDFLARYPGTAEKYEVIPNGFEPKDFQGLSRQRPVGDDHLVLTHAGFFYGLRRPDPLFQALRMLLERGGMTRRPYLQLVGDPIYNGQSLREIAASYGVEDFVHETGEVPHQQALDLLSGSDIQILVGFSGPGCELQVPAKLYDYMGVGLPVLALAPEQSAIGDIITQSGIEHELCEPNDPEEIANGISRLAARLDDASDHPTPGGAEGLAIEQFHRRAQVGRIAALLEELSQERL